MIYPMSGPPGPNLQSELEAQGITGPMVWLQGDSSVDLPAIEASSPEDAVASEVLAAHIPAPHPPGPPSLEERVAALEAWQATMESGG